MAGNANSLRNSLPFPIEGVRTQYLRGPWATSTSWLLSLHRHVEKCPEGLGQSRPLLDLQETENSSRLMIIRRVLGLCAYLFVQSWTGSLMAAAFLLYGATGFVGEAIARTAARTGLQPIVAGRDASKLELLATELGVEWRAFALDDVGSIDRAMRDVKVVLNCAGPFIHTARSMVEACLRSCVHYLDITGEIPVYQFLFARDAEAKAHGIMILPGVGFDVAPTDCLAVYLKSRLPTATHLKLAFQSVGPAGLPPGTQRTAIEMLPHGDRVRRDGLLVRPEQPAKTVSVDFGDGAVPAQLLPWGDVFTAYFSTGIPNIEDYIAAPPELRRQMALARAIAPLLKLSPVRSLLKRGIRAGPNAEARAKTRVHVWGEVTDGQGRMAVSRLHGPEAGVSWTTQTALAASRNALAGNAPPGFQTPAMAYGADFILDGVDVTREDVV
jgi:short subunit dehydrogenase-like uncharacterized protein